MYRILYLPEAIFVEDGYKSTKTNLVYLEFDSKESAEHLLKEQCFNQSDYLWRGIKVIYNFNKDLGISTKDCIPKHLLEIVEI